MTALYRKYRPQDFDEVVGQEAVVRTLRNAIGNDKVRQAYLFAGPRGTGKTSLARILAKGLNCEQGPTVSPDKTPGRYLGTIAFPDSGARQVTVSWDGPVGKGSTKFSVSVR